MSQRKTHPLNYSDFFHKMSTAYIVFDVDDPHFTILDENAAHATVAMVKQENVIGQPLLTAFPDTTDEYKETGVSQLLESIRRVIKTAEPDTMAHLKYDLKNQSGKMTSKYWSVTHFPVIEKGAVVAVYQMTEDITQRVDTERKLADIEHHLNQALSGGSIGTWTWNITKGVVIADENLAEMFGLGAESTTTGLPLSGVMSSIHPEDRKRVGQEIQHVLQTKEAYESEYRTINKNGDVRWVIARGTVEVDGNGEPISFPGVIIDITERKRAEDNLQFLTHASVQFSASLDYKKTLNNIAAMVVPTVADWCSVELLNENGQLEQVAVAHKDPEKVTWAKELRAKQGPTDMSEQTGAANVIRTKEAEIYPIITDEMLVMIARNKKELKLLRELAMTSVIVSPMVLDGKAIGVISLIATESRIHYNKNDLEVARGLANRAALAVYNSKLYAEAQNEIEKRKNLQQKLETFNNVLEKRVKDRTQELETTNKGLTKEISKRHKAENELKEYSKNLATSNQELQDFAYVASHDLQEPLRKIQAFGDLLETEYGHNLGEGIEYLNRMRSAASRMSILINDLLSFSRVSTKPQVPTAINLNIVLKEVVSDLEARIEQTNGTVEMENLPMVWADHTHMRQLFQNLIGNALKFHREDIAPVVQVSVDPLKKNDLFYTLYIKDNGIGFEEKYLDRIFSVFQRLHGKDVYEGTGIGLAVCRKIVERYGGTITAESKKNIGSTFIVKLPVVDKELEVYDNA